MVKEQTSFSQDLCLIQQILKFFYYFLFYFIIFYYSLLFYCVHLQIVIQHFVFPLFFSVYSTPYLLHTVQSFFQVTFTHVLKIDLIPWLCGFDTLFCGPIEVSIGLKFFLMEEFLLCGPRIPRDTDHLLVIISQSINVCATEKQYQQ